jgi:NitT/TauT family transport system ATP-binding protein
MMQELLLEVWTEYGMTVLFVTHDIDEAIYLGSQVAVLTRRPGRLKALFDVPLPRPRTIDTLVSKDFMKLKRTCMDLLREEMLGAPAATEMRGRDSNLPRDRLLVESADVAA